MLNFKVIKEKGLSFRLFWDLFMILVVLANLALIVFDLTYMYLRPYYFKYKREITKSYDWVHGVEPHRLTQNYVDLVDEIVKIETDFKNNSIKSSVSSKIEKLEKNMTSVRKEKNIEKFDPFLKEVEKLKTQQGRDEMLIYADISQSFFKALEETKSILEANDFDILEKDLDELNRLIRRSDEAGRTAEIESIYKKMDQLMVIIIEDDPFQKSGQTFLLQEIKDRIKDNFKKNATHVEDMKYRALLSNEGYTRKSVPTSAVAFAWFWRNESQPTQQKIDYFNREFRLKFELNYFPVMGKNGKQVYDFFKLDAPFFIFFLLEFIIKWILAIRRKTYAGWFMYPLYHWYDVLGLIPLAEFRFFRLFRIYTMYLLLQESEYTTVGNDFITRSIRYYSAIIKEELSDMVTVQILSDTQKEIKSGSSMDAFTKAVDMHRDEIKHYVISRLSDKESAERIGVLISEIVSTILGKGDFKEKFAKEAVTGILTVITKASGNLASTPSGKAAVEKIVDYVIDEIVVSAKDEDLNRLNQAITVDLLENVKNQVREKNWTKLEF